MLVNSKLRLESRAYSGHQLSRPMLMTLFIYQVYRVHDLLGF